MSGTSSGNKKFFTLLELFDGLICEEFQFGKQGISASYCISKPHILNVPKGAAAVTDLGPGSGGLAALVTPTTPKLAVHLNFKCTVGVFGDTLNLAITAFHLTARPVKGQQTIDEAGPSVLTAKESVHMNRNTGWGREENFKELLRVLDTPSHEDVLRVLNYNFPAAHMAHTVTQWKEKIRFKAQHNTRIMNITWRGSDKTFPSD